MHHRFRFKHWLILTSVWAAGLAIALGASAFVTARQLPPFDWLLVAMSLGSLIGTLQYRRDCALSIRESIIPWFLSATWLAALLFWSLSLTQSAPAVGTRLALAAGLGVGISLGCLIPLRWVISSFGASRYAP